MPDRLIFHFPDFTAPQPPKVVEDSSVDSSVSPTPDKQTNTQELHELSFETWVTTEIPKQYTEQVEVLNKLGILQLLIEKESGDMGIVGIDGREYPIPTLDNIQSELRTNKEKYETKQKQGFVKLQMTPFGLPLERLTMLLEERLVDHQKRGKLLATKNKPEDPNVLLELKLEEPFSVAREWVDEKLPPGERGSDVTGDCVYHPTNVREHEKINNGGLTKQQILDNQTTNNSPFAGWEVKLLEDAVKIPIKGQGKIIGGRKQLERIGVPTEYLRLFQENPTYQYEEGLTNEDWIIQFLIHLEQTNEIIDDFFGSHSYLVGSFNKRFGFPGGGMWNRKLASLFMSSDASPNMANGLRSAVPVGK